MPESLAAKVPKKKAEKTRRELISRELLAKGLKPIRSAGFVYFPVTRKTKMKGTVFCKKNFVEQGRGTSLREALKRKGFAKVFRAYDLVGDIAVIEVPHGLERKAKEIGATLLESNKRVKTVLEKTGGRKGVFRIQRLRWLAGGKKTRTTHKESGCVFETDLAKAYFSPRLSRERERVASLVQSGERVLVPFAGVGPFPIIIAKKTGAAEVIGIELNRDAARLFEKNVLLNKVGARVKVVEGDAKTFFDKNRDWADRIVMPLPHSAVEFLPFALKAAKKGCVIHLYGFEKEGGRRRLARAAKKVCAKAGRKFVFLRSGRVTDYAPGVKEVVLDFLVA